MVHCENASVFPETLPRTTCPLFFCDTCGLRHYVSTRTPSASTLRRAHTRLSHRHAPCLGTITYCAGLVLKQ